MTARQPGDRDVAATVVGPDEAARPVAPGGWRRAVIGLGVGVIAGALIALLLPRDRRP